MRSDVQAFYLTLALIILS